MRVLALDTSGLAGSAAIAEGDRLLAEITFHGGHGHAERVFPALDALFELAGLGKGEIDLLAVGLGPGGFTRVRVGLSTVKGLSLARDLPVVGVSSLLALARGLSPAGGLAGAFVDAGRGEVYAALYDLDAGDALLPPTLGDAGALASRVEEAAAGRGYVYGGDGLTRHADAIARAAASGKSAAPPFAAVRAGALAFEAARAHERRGPSDVDTLEPLYVRPSDAALPERRLRDPETVA